MSAFNAQEQAAVAEEAERVVIGDATLYRGDCIELMRTLPADSVDSIVTDPPYGISFMGKAWDGADIVARTERRRGFASHAPDAGPNDGHKSIAAEAGKYDLTSKGMRAFQEFSEEWAREAFRVLKPGGHLLSFSSARTYHRMTSGIEDAGFEIRDQIMWIFGSGFPKSQNISKAIDKAAGAVREKLKKRCASTAYSSNAGNIRPWMERARENGYVEVASDIPATAAAAAWDGWGTALKPAHEPICVARKPLAKGNTVAANVLAFGTGAINIDGCRVEPTGESRPRIGEASQDQRYAAAGATNFAATPGVRGGAPEGRWPANLLHDGSAEVVALFPDAKGQQGRVTGNEPTANGFSGAVKLGGMLGRIASAEPRVEIETSAARFFYCAKASRADRNAGLVDPGPQFEHGATLRKIEDAPKTGNIHPTVKPTDLMAYLCRLITPPGGVVLDPFMGSGSTGKGALRGGFKFIGFEIGAEYFPISVLRIQHEIDVIAASADAAAAIEPTPQLNLFSEGEP